MGELVRLDPKSKQVQPFLGGISAELVAFSKDGRSVAYVSYPDGILWRANRDGSDRVQLTSPPLRPKSLDWSPDSSQLAFMAPSTQGREQTWIVSAEGGTPQRLIPEDSGEETFPSWSPDGRDIIFSTGIYGEESSSIRILDVASHKITTLPGSAGLFAPHWSPDGQSIKADSLDESALSIFDMKTQGWSPLHIGVHAYNSWSSDSRYIYFVRHIADPAILRIPVTGGEVKMVVGLKGFLFAGTLGLWFGLDPTDTPLLLRDVSTTDALTLEKK